MTQAIQDTLALANDAVNEAVSGVRVIRSFNTEQQEARRYDDLLMDIVALKNRRDTVRTIYLLVYRVSLRVCFLQVASSLATDSIVPAPIQLTGLSMQVLMLYYGRLFIQNGQMTTGSLVSFILYQSELGNCIRVSHK